MGDDLRSSEGRTMGSCLLNVEDVAWHGLSWVQVAKDSLNKSQLLSLNHIF